MKKNWYTGAAILAAACGASTAQADIVDLTQSETFGVINGARFETADFRSAGTGVIDPFVRIQANGDEEGYNTSGRPVPFDETTAANFTRDLTLGEIRVIDVEGQNHYEFLLDINQLNNSSLLSLDQVKIYTSDVGGQNTTDLSLLGTLRYDMDVGEDSWVRMDYALASGSGQGDMRLLVPAPFFSGATTSTFVYLYSQFGTNITSNDGFEEWAVIIPTPGSAALGFTALGLLTPRRRTR